MIRLPDCPICGKPIPAPSETQTNFAPFCSRRCKEVDLVRWSEGRYAIVESIDPTKLSEIPQGDSDSDQQEDLQEFDSE